MIGDEIIHVTGDDMPELHKVKTLEDYIKDFLDQHDVRPASRERYKKSLKRFSEYVKQKNIQQITKAELKNYKEYLIDDKQGLSNLTVGAYIIAVRLFFAYLYEEDIIPKDIAKKISSPEKSKTHQRHALTVEECTALLNYYKPKSLRDYAMINLMLRTGLRTIEVVRANIEDIAIVGGKRRIWVHGKGRTSKTDFVLLEDPAFEPLTKYLESRQWHSKSEPLFVSESSNKSKGTRLTTKTVSLTARTGLNAIGLTGEEYTAHSCRNTFGTLLLASGVKLERVQQLMRHHNIQTTQGYVADAEEQSRISDAPESVLNNLF